MLSRPIPRCVVLFISLLLASSAPEAAEAPKPAFKPPFGCSAAAQDDWIGKRNPYAPAFNLHDALNLPDWLSVSVENRVRYESLDGQFRAGSTGGDQQLPIQTCAWLEARYLGFRIGTEFLDARQSLADLGSTSLNNTHVDEADFLQIYGAWSGENVLGSGVDMEVKLGRQTLDMGSRRLLARNTFRNTINAFSGALFRFRDSGDQWQLRLFGVQPVERFPNTAGELLDGHHRYDEEAYRTFFSGAFLEWFDIAYGISGEAYLFHLDEQDRPEAATADRELFTPGVRFFAKPAKGAFDFEVETIAQVGRSHSSTTATKTLNHQAWFQHVQAGYTFDLPWSPRFLAMYDYATGDSDPGTKDGSNGRFDTLFGARRFELGPTGIFGAFARSNINTPGYRLIVNPTQDVSFYAGHRLLWLAEDKDQWVGSRNDRTGISLQDKNGRSGDFLGHLIEASARWDVNSNLMLETGWAHLVKGEFAKNAPRAPLDLQDVDYFYMQSLLRF
jgi:hypothetical protein